MRTQVRTDRGGEPVGHAPSLGRPDARWAPSAMPHGDAVSRSAAVVALVGIEFRRPVRAWTGVVERDPVAVDQLVRPARAVREKARRAPRSAGRHPRVCDPTPKLARTAGPVMPRRSSSGCAQNLPSRTPMPASADKAVASSRESTPSTEKLTTPTASVASGKMLWMRTPGSPPMPATRRSRSARSCASHSCDVERGQFLDGACESCDADDVR